MLRSTSIAWLLLLASGSLQPTWLGAAEAPNLSATDRSAAYRAAGFKARGNEQIRCEEDPPTMSYVPGKMEVVDLNADGQPEALVTESSVFCYGHAGSAFVLVGKDGNGRWGVLLEAVGIAVQRNETHRGWPDIEVGGPGPGPFPIYRFDGRRYVKHR